MVRARTSAAGGAAADGLSAEEAAERDEVRRLRELAKSTVLCSDAHKMPSPRFVATSARVPAALRVGSGSADGVSVDVIKRNTQRRGSTLFVFPGAASPPPSGGRIGALVDVHGERPSLRVEYGSGAALTFRGVRLRASNAIVALRVVGSKRKRKVFVEDVLSQVLAFTEWSVSDDARWPRMSPAERASSPPSSSADERRLWRTHTVEEEERKGEVKKEEDGGVLALAVSDGDAPAISVSGDGAAPGDEGDDEQRSSRSGGENEEFAGSSMETGAKARITDFFSPDSFDPREAGSGQVATGGFFGGKGAFER